MGKDVRIADRSQHSELDALREDFVIFDMESANPAVILFEYDEDGRLRGYRPVVVGGSFVERYRQQFDLALSLSVPVAEFTAAATA